MGRWTLVALALGACAIPASTTPEVTLVASVPPTLSTTTSTTTTPLAGANHVFEASSSAVTADELGASWHESCPVSVKDLRRISVSHRTFDGTAEQGFLVVHADAVDDLTSVFRMLFAMGYPIERMDPIEMFEGSDDDSMAANNTSAFNCRAVAGTNIWSQHAYGTAVDINPLVNPYVVGESVHPPGGRTYLDRTLNSPGMIVEDGPVVTAFRGVGWIWGGTWENKKDYQHFSTNGQ